MMRWGSRLELGLAASLLRTGCASVTADGPASVPPGTGAEVADGTGGIEAGTTGSGFFASGGSAGLITSGGGGNAGAPSCGLQTFDLRRKPADLFLVLDRSASMQDDSMGKQANPPVDPSKWDQVVPALTQIVNQTSARIPWGLKVFPEDGSECSSGTVTNRIDVPVAPANGAALVSAIASTTPNGNGTPTRAAIDVAVTYLQGFTDGNPKYIVLATDGAPSCAGTIGSLAKSSAQARTDAVAAVSAAAQLGIQTFVIGVATTSASDTTTLNNLAMAGLQARTDPNPLAPKFYLASSQADLVMAFQTITGMIAMCRFTLTPPPPDPARIAVKVSGVKVPQDTAHQDGWDYTGADHASIDVYRALGDEVAERRRRRWVEPRRGRQGHEDHLELRLRLGTDGQPSEPAHGHVDAHLEPVPA